MTTTPQLYGLSFGKKVAVQTPVIPPNTIVVPTNVQVPVISGTTQIGQTLTTTNGLWLNNPISYSYQWYRAGGKVAIFGALANSYIPGAADVGSALTVSVIALNTFGASQPESSAATSNIIDIIPTINTPPSIPGFMPTVGVPITAIDAVWNNSVISSTYQWQVAGVNGTGAGATTLTYTPALGDLGLTLIITAIATNSGGTSLPSASAHSAPVAPSGLNNSTPYVILLAA